MLVFLQNKGWKLPKLENLKMVLGAAMHMVGPGQRHGHGEAPAFKLFWKTLDPFPNSSNVCCNCFKNWFGCHFVLELSFIVIDISPFPSLSKKISLDDKSCWWFGNYGRRLWHSLYVHIRISKKGHNFGTSVSSLTKSDKHLLFMVMGCSKFNWDDLKTMEEDTHFIYYRYVWIWKKGA